MIRFSKALLLGALLIFVSSAFAQSLPYTPPSAGQAVLIGTNTVDSIKPSTHDSFNWTYALFTAYGGGTFVRDFSSSGAFVIAGTGGHQAPPNFGAAVFDFQDATWKRIDNANGMAWRSGDIDVSEVNSINEIALSGVTPDSMPAPAHMYMNLLPLSAANGGGPKGSVISMVSFYQTKDARTSTHAHKFDLNTRLWSRLSTNAASSVMTQLGVGESHAVYDLGSNRYYQLASQLHGTQNIAYLEPGGVWQYKAALLWPTWPPGSPAVNSSWIDPTSTRRLILLQSGTSDLRAIQLDNISGGYKFLTLSGSMPSKENRWEYYPPTGSFYTYQGSGQLIHKLTPPASGNGLTGTWTVTTETISGATLPPEAAGGPRHYTRFFYVPSLQSFAWIGGGATDRVALIKPSGGSADTTKPKSPSNLRMQ
jgi:hypothetical protein